MVGAFKQRGTEVTGDPLLSLTDRQKIFIDCMLKGQNQTNAARSAGYANPGVEANRMMRNPKVREAMTYLHKKHERSVQMTRRQVMEGFKEAIDMARIQGESNTMVNGWREIGRMCGYYAPEVKKIDVNITAKRAIDKLETLTDAELMEMIEDDNSIIEGEAMEVLDTLQDISDAEFSDAEDD